MNLCFHSRDICSPPERVRGIESLSHLSARSVPYVFWFSFTRHALLPLRRKSNNRKAEKQMWKSLGTSAENQMWESLGTSRYSKQDARRHVSLHGHTTQTLPTSTQLNFLLYSHSLLASLSAVHQQLSVCLLPSGTWLCIYEVARQTSLTLHQWKLPAKRKKM